MILYLRILLPLLEMKNCTVFRVPFEGVLVFAFEVLPLSVVQGREFGGCYTIITKIQGEEITGLVLDFLFELVLSFAGPSAFFPGEFQGQTVAFFVIQDGALVTEVIDLVQELAAAPLLAFIDFSLDLLLHVNNSISRLRDELRKLREFAPFLVVLST